MSRYMDRALEACFRMDSPGARHVSQLLTPVLQCISTSMSAISSTRYGEPPSIGCTACLLRRLLHCLLTRSAFPENCNLALCRVSGDGDLGAALGNDLWWTGLEQSMLAFDRSVQKLVSTLRKPAAGEGILAGVLAHLSLNGYYKK